MGRPSGRPSKRARKLKFDGPVARVRTLRPADDDLREAIQIAEHEISGGHKLPDRLGTALMVFLRARRKIADENIVVNAVREAASKGHPVTLTPGRGQVTAFEAAAEKLKGRYGTPGNVARIYRKTTRKG
jgi:hypothetical protein